MIPHFGVPSTTGVAVVLLLSCSTQPLTRPPPFVVLEGDPQVDYGSPAVIDDLGVFASPTDFASLVATRPQVDLFVLPATRKFDILWVIDNSCSMVEEQQAVATGSADFLTALQTAFPPLDYHLGIVTTDAIAERGALRELATDPGRFYIACASGSCDVVDEVVTFAQTATVGTTGSAVEKGLLSAYLAVSEPMWSGTNAGFLRDDAELVVVIVSDEGDSSCDPIEPAPSGDDLTSCNFTPQCRCDDTSATFGTTDYWVRAFQTLKGFGNGDAVTLSALVAVDMETYVNGTKTYAGCSGAGGFGLHAPRYVALASRTGGLASSICDIDTSTLFTDLGARLASGQADVLLTYPPMNLIRPVFTVTLQRDPDDRATRVLVPEAATNPAGDGGWTYVGCNGALFAGRLLLSDAYAPSSVALLEVRYEPDRASPPPSCP